MARDDLDAKGQELPMAVGVEHEHLPFVGTGSSRPESFVQALMETAPGHQPATSIEETSELYLRLADAVESLPDRERWVFERHHYEGLSFREIAPMMGLKKSTVSDIYQRACSRMRESLLQGIEERGHDE